jgi:hypothetical protein
MKKVITLLILAVVFFGSPLQAQLVFGVKPGLTGNSAHLGLKLSGLMVFGGIEYFRTAVTTEESGSNILYSYNYNPLTYQYTTTYSLQPYSDKLETSLNVYAPFVGAKILVGGGESSKAGAYVTGIIGKPFISGKSTSNGKEDESMQKFYENLSAWMFMAGFGGEYFFSESFSIGGEFGLRIFLVNYKDESNETTQMYDYQTGSVKNIISPHKYNFDLGMGLTYSTLVLNYYF